MSLVSFSLAVLDIKGVCFHMLDKCPTTDSHLQTSALLITLLVDLGNLCSPLWVPLLKLAWYMTKNYDNESFLH